MLFGKKKIKTDSENRDSEKQRLVSNDRTLTYLETNLCNPDFPLIDARIYELEQNLELVRASTAGILNNVNALGNEFRARIDNELRNIVESQDSIKQAFRFLCFACIAEEREDAKAWAIRAEALLK